MKYSKILSTLILFHTAFNFNMNNSLNIKKETLPKHKKIIFFITKNTTSQKQIKQILFAIQPGEAQGRFRIKSVSPEELNNPVTLLKAQLIAHIKNNIILKTQTKATTST